MHKSEAPYPYMSINGAFIEKAFLDDVWEEMYRMAPIWAAGVASPTKSERLAYQVLNMITLRRPEKDWP
jgi:hypothetical protein